MKIQRRKAVELKDTKRYSCRKLLSSYKIVKDKNEDKELIESTEDIVDDVLNTHLRILALLKNDPEKTINNAKDDIIYVNCRSTCALFIITAIILYIYL